MDRKNFLRVIASIPLLNIPFRIDAQEVDTACRTQRDAEGPFYKANAPMRSVIETKGDKLVIRGTVYSSANCNKPLADVVLDIWHCDDDGNYDLKGYRGRGLVKTDQHGKYTFTTIYPPPYGNRPRHIHFKVRASGREELTTQLYFEGDPNIQNDFARNAEKNRVIGLKVENNLKTGVFDIYV
jgi:protocatechuate 3,4-dioxygenase beta subunit